jgi:hypothetical protein
MFALDEFSAPGGILKDTLSIPDVLALSGIAATPEVSKP